MEGVLRFSAKAARIGGRSEECSADLKKHKARKTGLADRYWVYGKPV